MRHSTHTWRERSKRPSKVIGHDETVPLALKNVMDLEGRVSGLIFYTRTKTPYECPERMRG